MLNIEDAQMADQTPESAFSLPLPEAIGADCCPKPATLEEEVAGLFERLRDRLLRYLLSFGLPIQDGEEVIQDVFLSLFLHLQRGRPRDNLRGWVFRVAHNLALKRQTRSYGAFLNLACLAGSAEDLLVDPAPNAEAQMANSQQQQRLWAVLCALPEQDRRCLALRAEGLSYREIAEVLGISLGAVSNLLGRSLARLERAAER
jgi:RNA polymerase sigma-70 factor (ECF subfamily)